MRTFTLVPVGGLGNRLHAICSAIAYCQKKSFFLTILWFKDHGLNCDCAELFRLAPSLEGVRLSDNKWYDLIIRDNPRRRNFHIPRFFEKCMYEKCIYYYDKDFHVRSTDPELDDSLDRYGSIYMVSCGDYWRFPSPDKWIIIHDEIKERIAKVREKFGTRTIGVHIRRTDGRTATANSPLSLYIEALDAEIDQDPSVRIFLASDSLEEKDAVRKRYGERVITVNMKQPRRNTAEGIKDAFTEMCLLGNTDRIYAGQSSFVYFASRMYGTELVLLDLVEIAKFGEKRVMVW